MPDPRFHKKSRSYTVGELADLLGCKLCEGANRDYLINDVAPLSSAGANDLSFLDNVKYKQDFLSTKAGACIVTPKMAEIAPKGLICLISDSPYKSYALAARSFYPEEAAKGSISDNAVIHKSVEIGEGCIIEDLAVIAEGVKIGDKSWIGSGVVIRENVEIGSHCKVGANATLSHCLIGDYVNIYPGACIGQDGFGFAIDPKGHVKIPQLGRVIIGNHVEIGANTTIDRGAGPDTIIGDGTWIDNLVQIGHNANIGKGCIIVAQVGISGSTTIGDYTAIGGQSGIAGHLKIGKGVKIAAKSGVMRDIADGEYHIGSPSFPSKQYFRQIAALKRLINNKKSD